jgi:hypothetical protein
VLIKDDVFLSLAGCLNKITKDISHSIRQKSSKVNGKWNIKNDNGDLLILDRWNYQKVASHYYFGIERQILKACGIDDENVVLVHDGFLADKEFELEMFEGKVKDKLGLNITFSKELL